MTPLSAHMAERAQVLGYGCGLLSGLPVDWKDPWSLHGSLPLSLEPYGTDRDKIRFPRSSLSLLAPPTMGGPYINPGSPPDSPSERVSGPLHKIRSKDESFYYFKRPKTTSFAFAQS